MTKIVKDIYMVRKPSDLEEIISICKNAPKVVTENINIAETVELTAEEYDNLATHPLADYEFLKGKGGYKDDVRQVVQIIAPDRLSIFVDPSGSAYCRYAGINTEELICK